MSPLYNFDLEHERRNTDSIKWTAFGEAIPMWVADTDFLSPPSVQNALRQRVEHGIFGYAFDNKTLSQTIVERMGTRYGWEIEGKHIIWLPNLVSALNASVRAFVGAGEAVLMNTPIYPPFLTAPANMERERITVPLAKSLDGQILRYEIDFDALETTITPQTRLFMLCNPHNPIGRAYSRAELERLAELSIKHNLIVCADEIHCDLMFDGTQHIPFASLGAEVAARTLTLFSPSKTFNIPTLGFAFAVAQNADVQARFNRATQGIIPHATAFGFTGALAAYGDAESQAWVDELLPYLASNRDYLVSYTQTHFPKVKLTRPEATYLAWMDWSAYDLGGSAFKFFLEKAQIAFSNGADFDPVDGNSYIRVNLGCTRATLHTVLERMRDAVEGVG